ncbi:uncharacterized protein LOC123300574 isoform X3 [Chrysoperla carnea]|nr:uncharacterized protein LOC123300574 isoform X3 [Chrysoperla carnea]
MSFVASLLFGLAIFLIVVGLCQCISFVFKIRAIQEEIRAGAIREQRMRVMTIQNVAFTCDPLNDYPRPLRQTYPDRYGSQPPMYDEGVFPSDSIGILEIPPPTYEEALRAALVHSNNNRNETTSPTTINISNDNNSTSSS